MKQLYQKQIIKQAPQIAEALARGQDVAINTTKTGDLKIKILTVNILKQEQNASGRK